MVRQFNIQSILRESIKKIKPYSSARDEFSGEASIFLDANENPLGSVGGSENNRYPDPYQRDLKKAISRIKNVAVENIFVGNGSDEAIDLLFKAFCYPGKDKALAIAPSYGMYKVSADVNDVEIIDIKLTSKFQPNVEEILKKGKDSGAKLLFLCSPNNPTGNLLERSLVKQILDSFDGMVIVDEAYIDFSSEPSWIAELPNYPNLVVLQTLSKAWGLANLRIGMLFASSELIKILNKIKLPYNISGIAQQQALEALARHSDKDAMVAEILKQRRFLLQELPEVACVTHVYPSDANFILVKTTNPNAIYNYLVENKIVVRNRNNILLCEGCLRITVGTGDENHTLLDSLKKIK